jgi:hypothetical protein
MICLLPLPLPPLPSVRTGDTQEDKERKTTCRREKGEGGGGGGQSYDKEKVLYKPFNTLCAAKKKCRKFKANISRKGISGPQSQFPHSCVCERIIYSHDEAAVSAGGNMWTDTGNI